MAGNNRNNQYNDNNGYYDEYGRFIETVTAYDENGNPVYYEGYYDEKGNFNTEFGYFDPNGNFYQYNYEYNEDSDQHYYANSSNNTSNNYRQVNRREQINQNNNYVEKKDNRKKSIIPTLLTAIITLIVLSAGLYFGYAKFIKTDAAEVDLSRYEINFVSYGTNGEGKPEADIKRTPEVKNTTTEISNFLSNPDISFDKQSNLKNGDKVEVTITLNKNTAEKLKLKTIGEFKRTFTVNGLNEKSNEKETIIVKDNSDNTSNKSSSSSSDSSRDSSRKSEERTVYVKPSAGANLRRSASDSSSIITSIKVGQSVSQHYVETNSDGEKWAYVTYNGKNGWIRADLIG